MQKHFFLFLMLFIKASVFFNVAHQLLNDLVPVSFEEFV